MKRILIIFVTVLFSFMVLGWIALTLASEPLPKSIESEEAAEVLTDQMMKAIGKDAYDSIAVLEWSFPRGHRFVWNKTINRVTATWGENKVVFFPDDLVGTAYVNEVEVTDDAEKQELIQKAWALFANDSFWLVAPFKARDPGTSRTVVQTDRGKGLLVTYSSGGVTPGDSYLWILDEQSRPVAWKMWVSILPVKGLEFSWSQGQEDEGVWLAPIHQGPMGYNVDLIIHRVE